MKENEKKTANNCPTRDARRPRYQDPCIRAENEDDDGYDPYSDRRPDPEPFFEEDPWS